ncbi:carbon-nitrogen family hydrolase [Geomesophilobacter sediminis]|uniref:Carbon-nitrogen family hydrolase n=1 Tax=Geomesophilobacter sediminis TaxID=2798584 RepID=A0A8J7JG83_9BACT|nr:carbon-nitrogen family hydrolase [Geomesophilobacter sediminis]MBJ6725619.1 carbon-nitrogen family hydrolase [Geomesophilobacter sediminis]
MDRKIKAAAVQFTIALGEIEKNLEQAKSALARLAKQQVELVVLPEMWATGFSYKDLNRLAQKTPEVVAEIARLSADYGMVIVGSLPEPHGEKVYNTSYVADRGQIVGSYRKMHLFSLMGEDRSLDAGDAAVVVPTSVGSIGLMICYDIRFPELARRLTLDGASIIAVPGEWPKPRQDHWRTILRARAMENQLFVIAANACGVTGKLDFFGDSLVLGVKGEILGEGGYEPGEVVAELDPAEMLSWRGQITCLKDRRPDCY